MIQGCNSLFWKWHDHICNINNTNTLAYKIVQAFPQGLHVAHSDILKPVFLWCDKWLDSVFKIDEYYFTFFLNYRTHVNCHDTQRIIMFVKRFVREYGLWSLFCSFCYLCYKLKRLCSEYCICSLHLYMIIVIQTKLYRYIYSLRSNALRAQCWSRKNKKEELQSEPENSASHVLHALNIRKKRIMNDEKR